MKTFWAAMIIFVGIIAGGIALNVCLDNLSSELYDRTKEIGDMVEEENFETAYKKSKEMSEFIDGKKPLLASVLDHENIDEIEDGISELLGYTKRKDLTEASVRVRKLEHLLEHLPKNYQLELQNIL